MNTDITINDGTTARTYLSALGGAQRVKPGVVEHFRKTAEFDNTPETLTTVFAKEGNLHRSKLVFEKTKINATTGKKSVMKTIVTHIVEPGEFTQTESDNQIKEVSVFTGTAGIATDISRGNM